MLVPLYRRARRAACRAAAYVRAVQPSLDFPRAFGATAHAGEEFRSLQEGLRRMGELIDAGVLGQNDRVGHGVALGVPPEEWADAARIMYQPVEERLADDLFELDLIERAKLTPDQGRVAVLQRRVGELARRLGGAFKSATVRDLVEFRRALHEGQALTLFAYPHVSPDSGPQAGMKGRLLYEYLTDENVARRGLAPAPVPVGAPERSALVKLQAWLRRRFNRLEITVETNPSSNLLIGDFGCFEQHPAWRMSQSDLSSDGVSAAVRISINDDDPITFATRLSDEYAYLHAELLSSGRSSHQALAWIDQARANGLSSRFTLDLAQHARILAELGGRTKSIQRA